VQASDGRWGETLGKFGRIERLQLLGRETGEDGASERWEEVQPHHLLIADPRSQADGWANVRQPGGEVLLDRLSLAHDGHTRVAIADGRRKAPRRLLSRLRVERLALTVFQRDAGHPAAVRTLGDAALAIPAFAGHVYTPCSRVDKRRATKS